MEVMVAVHLTKHDVTLFENAVADRRDRHQLAGGDLSLH
jgi:hypothetical protein